MDELVVCQVCHRHVKQKDAACPFCRSAMPPLRAVALAGALVVGVAAGMSLAGCGESVALYGGPPYEQDGGLGGGGGEGGGGGSTTSTGSGGDTNTGGSGQGGAVAAYGPPPFDAGP